MTKNWEVALKPFISGRAPKRDYLIMLNGGNVLVNFATGTLFFEQIRASQREFMDGLSEFFLIIM
ncbi:hypothetical protein [Methylobacter sp.]|uniref:hypothetical protein n=1 Tax=Methylobacter sp. TaxID=2051955 RepID=UPI002FDE764A